ncbi:MAG TPA: hypothetical protein VL651_08310 [Bacteroidia bacterium]|jgi:hypothetical protein|nr:hypothetical protein [Bacteroidia bacterium]
MKFYRYPLAIVAYALIFVYGVAMAWIKMGDMTPASYWLWFPGIAGIYLACSFILSKIKMTWELDVVIQVALVLAPILWYVNQKDSYKRPQYVFVAEPDYKGELEIHFSSDKNAPTNARSIADTIYFKFDNTGRMLINEDGEYVKKMMKKNLFFFYPDHTKKQIPFVEYGGPKPKGEFVQMDSIGTEKGKLTVLYYSVSSKQ